MATGKKTGGRGKGTPNKATAERQAAIAASGKTPLEIMLENTRWAYAEAIQLTERLADAEPSLETEELFRQMLRFRQLAVEWAQMAAPYVHPRLAAVAHKHTNPDGSPIAPIVKIICIKEIPADPVGESGDDIPDRRH
jgi:hypothetical protein